LVLVEIHRIGVSTGHDGADRGGLQLASIGRDKAGSHGLHGAAASGGKEVAAKPVGRRRRRSAGVVEGAAELDGGAGAGDRGAHGQPTNASTRAAGGSGGELENRGEGEKGKDKKEREKQNKRRK
jgi:hypothetical protein